MSNNLPPYLLLIDGLQRTLVNPTLSLRWHELLDYYKLVKNPELRARVRHSLLHGVPRTGVTGFFLATFMHEVTGELAYLDEAGLIVQQIAPLDPDRLMAFIVFLWGHFISRSTDRAHFVNILRTARMHEIVSMLGRNFAETTKTCPPLRPVASIKKVALVASYIGQDSHAPTPLALQHARLLRDLGYQVHLFSPQELRVQDMPHYMGNNMNLVTYAPDVAQLRKMVPEGVSLTLSDERFSLTRRWEDLLLSVGKFDPDLVMFVGLNCPFIEPLFQTRPVLGLCVHATPPMAPVDVWLTANPDLANTMSTIWGPEIPEAWGHFHPFRVTLKAKGAPVPRAELGLRESSLVLISVGARLQGEIEGLWAERMCELLTRHAEVQWLLVGGAGTLPPALAEHSAPDQFKVMRHHADLRSVMSHCDIYVNPPRVGGGFSVAEAMAEGLPVTAFANSDGGDKIGSAASTDIDAYFTRLEELIVDSSKRQACGKALQALFNETLNLEQAGPSLRDACELTLKRFQQRTAQAMADIK